MTATDILELVRAGFTKQEISTMCGVQMSAAQTPAAQTPAAQILPAMSYDQPQIYTPVLPGQRDVTIDALKNENEALNRALDVLQRGMINNPVNGGQVTVENVLESMINPPITK